MSNLFENILSDASESVKESSERFAAKKNPGDEWEVTDEFLGYKRKRVAEWRTPDFFHFFLDMFERKFGEPFEIAPAAGQQSILLIKDAIHRALSTAEGYLDGDHGGGGAGDSLVCTVLESL